MRSDTNKIIKILTEGETNPDTGKVYFDEEDAEYFKQFLEPFATVIIGSKISDFYDDTGLLIIRSNGNEYINPPREIGDGDNPFNITKAFIDKVEEYCAKKYPNARVDCNNTANTFWMYERHGDKNSKMKTPIQRI